MVLVDGVSGSFRHLEGSELIVKEPSGEHDTFITVDCADFKRVGKVFENFGGPNTNASALRLSARLMETGVDMTDLYMRALVKKSFPAARYWGAGLSRLEQKN